MIIACLCRSLTLKIVGFCDTDGASYSDSRCSTRAYCVYFENSLISWVSSKQKMVSRSSTGAEYRALTLLSIDIIWLRSLLKELGISCYSQPIAFWDNMRTQHLAKNLVMHARTKHIEVDFYFIREQVTKQELDVQYLSTQD